MALDPVRRVGEDGEWGSDSPLAPDPQVFGQCPESLPRLVRSDFLVDPADNLLDRVQSPLERVEVLVRVCVMDNLFQEQRVPSDPLHWKEESALTRGELGYLGDPPPRVAWTSTWGRGPHGGGKSLQEYEGE